MQFHVLGPLEVSSGNGPVPLGGPKQRAVLAHLVIRANQVVPAAILIDEIWGDEPPASARNTLQTYVSHLRKALGEGRIDGRSPGYLLAVGRDELDADRFDDLVRAARKAAAVDPVTSARLFDDALELWRGPAFADLADEPSLAGEAARLNEIRLVAIEERLDALLAAGDHTQVVSEAESLVGRHPLRERLWGQLMLALYRAGRQADALSAFGRAREILADELGIDPSPDLIRLQERILHQDPTLELRGEPLRGYRLLEQIGEGPQGTVFRAIQPKVERDVAVKIIHGRIASDPAFVRGFEARAQAVAGFDHPHVVPVNDYWREPDAAYIVSRYLRGGSLAARQASGVAMDPAAAAHAVDQVASALAAAHRQGLAHGNLVASNVLFDAEGNAYLSDLSIGSTAAPDPGDDVVALARLTRGLLGTALPASVAEVLDGIERRDTVLDADTLAEAVRGAFEPSTPTVAPRSAAVRNPYKGLRAFTQADAKDLFGRDVLIEQLLGALAEPGATGRFLALVGPSGSGKSSVVRAGLLPRLGAGALPISEGWFVAEMIPGTHPMEELEAALVRISIRPVPRLLHRLEAGSRGLLEVIGDVVPDGAEVVLVVDQFEELFTMTASDTERDLFLETIRVAAADPASRVRVVVTLRADFFDRPLQHPRFSDLLGDRTIVVSPLTPDEMERAISGPAASVGVRVEPGLVAEIIGDVAHQPGPLPLVEFALTELFERPGPDGSMTLETYRELGGVTGALTARAEQLYRAAGPDGAKAIRQVLLRLVTLGEGREDTRRRVSRSELATLDINPQALDAVLDAFGRHRFLTFDREPSTREPTVEIAHEALLREWPRLRGWIDGSRDDLRRLRLLSRSASEWRGADADPSFLLVGSRLDQAESWIASTELAIGRNEREYLAASTAQRERERSAAQAREAHEADLERRSRSRLRTLVAVLAIAALIAASLTLVALGQRGEARRTARLATARELAAAAIANLEVDPERSILLALEAVRAAEDETLPREVEEALHAAVRADRMLFAVHDPSTGNVAWSPDGSLLATGGEIGGEQGVDVKLWDARTGALAHTLTGHEADITSVTWSPDGSRLASTAADGVIVWNPRTGDELFALPAHAGGASFSLDGRTLVIATEEGEVRLVDATTGEVLRSVGQGGCSPQLSPDGIHLLVGICSEDGFQFAAQIWDLRTGRHVSDLSPADSAVYSPDGEQIATRRDSTVTVWDARTGRPDYDLADPSQAGFVYGLAWSADGSRIATGGSDGKARVFDTTTHARLQLLAGHGAVVGVVDFSPDGTRLLTGGGDHTARVWDITPGGSAEIAAGFEPWPIEDVTFNPDGSTISTGSFASSWLWATDTGDRLRSFPDTSGAATFDPSGTTMTIGWWADDPGGPAVFDLTTDADPHVLDVELGWPVAFTPDGARVATYRDEKMVVWDEVAGERRMSGSLEEPGYKEIAFSPDGRMLAGISGFATLHVWDAASGEELLPPFQAQSGQGQAVSFSPDGTAVATSGNEGAAVWSVPSGELVRRFPGGLVNDVVFSADGALLATAEDDGTTTLWDVGSGLEKLRLAGGSRLNGVAIDPGGTRLATVGDDGVLSVSTLDVDELVAIARSRLTRGFIDAECRQYLHLSACTPELSAAPTAPAPVAIGPAGAAAGVYRIVIDPDDLAAAEFPEGFVADNVGTFTLSLTDGRFRLHQTHPDGWTWETSGPYEVDGDTVTFTWETDAWCQGATDTVRWDIDGAQLTLDHQGSTGTCVPDETIPSGWDRAFFGSEPWVRVGDHTIGG